jgi:hypothetical protein
MSFLKRWEIAASKAAPAAGRDVRRRVKQR